MSKNKQQHTELPVLFDRLAKRYHFTNFLSLGLSGKYRKRLLALAGQERFESVADLMCGSGQNFGYLQMHPGLRYSGYDFSAGMIRAAGGRVADERARFYLHNVLDNWMGAQASLLLCTFGLKCISTETYDLFAKRVREAALPGATVLILEAQYPSHLLLRAASRLYLHTVGCFASVLFTGSNTAMRALHRHLAQAVNPKLLTAAFERQGMNLQIELRLGGALWLATAVVGKKAENPFQAINAQHAVSSCPYPNEPRT